MEKIKDEGVESVNAKHRNIFEAMSSMQGELKPIEQTAHVKFKAKTSDTIVDYKFAPYSEITKVIYPLLQKHGLSFRHAISKTGIECLVFFSDGSSFGSGELALDLLKPDMKDVGAQITYGKRITLGLVLGISTEEDKDTELINTSTKNTQSFAFKQIEEKLKGVKTPEELETQIIFLKKELELAEALVNKTGTKSPSLGLEVDQYKKLLELSETRFK